jgi:hypothetical protein
VQDGPTDRASLDIALEVRVSQHRAQELFDRATAWKLQYSAIVGPLITARLREERVRFVDAQKRYAKLVTTRSSENRGAWVLGPPSEEDPLDVCVRTWSEASRSLAAMCSGRSIRFVHVLQPTLHDTGSKPLTEDELKSSMLSQEWMDAVKAGYPRLREVGAELARSGIAFHDESMLFEHVEQSLYYDGIHFAVAGHQMFARAIADAILEQLEREPVAPQEPRPRARGKKKKQGAK